METKSKEKYMIVRYYKNHNKISKILKTHLTLEEAQEHCSNPKTRKEGVWFDGYTKQDILR